MAIGRRSHEQEIGQIRGSIGVAQGAVPLLLGTLADGDRVLRTDVYIDTAFNAGTTNVLNIDDNVTTGRFLPAATTLAGAAGIKGGQPSSVANAVAVGDTNVYATYTQTGTVATTGQAEVVVQFTPPNG